MATSHVSSVPTHRTKPFFALLLLFAAWTVIADQTPRNSFCRRYGHQTTVIDDKLYIDGGYVNFNTSSLDHPDIPNTWNGFQDLNNLTTGDEPWPQLNIGLTKDPAVIPTVYGGVLWGDSVYKQFYVFGGAMTAGLPADFHQFRYDIVHDSWDDLGAPKTPVPPTIASYGGGIGVSETGEGYYYGGWISNASMPGWSRPPAMSLNFYKYDYDTNNLTLMNSPDGLPRAEGAMAWIPAGNTGLIVYFGGLVDLSGNGGTDPQSLNKILVYDPLGNAWFTQTATGQIPEDRSRFCIAAAWAPDRSSYNIYLWGGRSIPSPTGSFTAYDDVYILTLPSFIWAKVFPDYSGNATDNLGHYSSSCSMVKSNSQMLVIGGVYQNASTCDQAAEYWGQHNFWTGTLNNDGNNATFWALFNPNITSNVVPIDVYGIVGGDKNGGATLVSPRSGYDPGNARLETLLKLKPSFCRGANHSSNCTGPSETSSKTSSSISTGAIVGIAIGSVAALVLLISGLYLVFRRARRPTQAPQSQMTPEPSKEHDNLQGPWEADSRVVKTEDPPPAELDAQETAIISELGDGK